MREEVKTREREKTRREGKGGREDKETTNRMGKGEEKRDHEGPAKGE